MFRFFVWSHITARILMFQRKSSNICLKVHQNGGDIAARYIFVFRFWPLNLGIRLDRLELSSVILWVDWHFFNRGQLFQSLNRARYSAMYGRLEVEWATDGNRKFLCAGVLIPSFKVGAAFGRMVGEGLHLWFPHGVHYGSQGLSKCFYFRIFQKKGFWKIFIFILR